MDTKFDSRKMKFGLFEPAKLTVYYDGVKLGTFQIGFGSDRNSQYRIAKNIVNEYLTEPWDLEDEKE